MGPLRLHLAGPAGLPSAGAERPAAGADGDRASLARPPGPRRHRRRHYRRLDPARGPDAAAARRPLCRRDPGLSLDRRRAGRAAYGRSDRPAQRDRPGLVSDDAPRASKRRRAPRLHRRDRPHAGPGQRHARLHAAPLRPDRHPCGEPGAARAQRSALAGGDLLAGLWRAPRGLYRAGDPARQPRLRRLRAGPPLRVRCDPASGRPGGRHPGDLPAGRAGPHPLHGPPAGRTGRRRAFRHRPARASRSAVAAAARRPDRRLEGRRHRPLLRRRGLDRGVERRPARRGRRQHRRHALWRPA